MAGAFEDTAHAQVGIHSHSSSACPAGKIDVCGSLHMDLGNIHDAWLSPVRWAQTSPGMEHKPRQGTNSRLTSLLPGRSI